MKTQKTLTEFFAALKQLEKHGFYFFKLEKTQKTWIQFFFCTLKKAPKYELNFYNLKNAQKTLNPCF